MGCWFNWSRKRLCGLWLSEGRQREVRKTRRHEFWAFCLKLSSSPLFLSASGDWDWFHLKHLKQPRGIHARLWNKYQDLSRIVFKLNAICQSSKPSFHFFSPSLISPSSTWCQPLFVSITKGFSGILLLQRQAGKGSLPYESFGPEDIWYIAAIKM